MEEYLKDSPSEFGNSNRASNSNMGLNDSGLYEQDQYGADLDSFSMAANPGMGIPQNTYMSGSMYAGIPENEFLSPTASAFNTDTQNYASSVKSDPFLEDLESLNFPHNQQNNALQGQYMDPLQSTTTNLDEIISPGNTNGFDTGGLNSQYFSPPSNRNYNGLNAIAEDSLSSSFNNAFSPNMSRHGSVSVAVPAPNNFASSFNDTNVGSYLSPPTNSQFMSPGHSNNYDSFDTLRSPSFNSASYLNSPPQYQNMRIPSANSHSSSIPNNINSNILSPPNTSHLGMSAPSSSEMLSNGSYGNVAGSSTKQLSKDEKLKRRREFHNAVERRRRDLIKERIKDLGLLVPPSLLNPQLCAVQTLQKSLHLNLREINDLLASLKVKETKPNKSTILNKSVDYILHLKYVLEQQDQVQATLSKQIAALEAKMSVSGSGKPSDPQDLSNLVLGAQDLLEVMGLDATFNPDDFFADLGSESGIKNEFANY